MRESHWLGTTVYVRGARRVTHYIYAAAVDLGGGGGGARRCGKNTTPHNVVRIILSSTQLSAVRIVNTRTEKRVILSVT